MVGLLKAHIEREGKLKIELVQVQAREQAR
jgi:hypothetical protein